MLQRDERAFRTMYRAHTPALHRLALRMTGGSEADAEDVIQETWRRAVPGLAGFERRSTLRTWLSSIVVRCALAVRRRESRATRVPREDVVGRNGQVGAMSRIDLERAFERLPRGYRAVLVLHDLEGYRHSDIADILDVSTGTSKSQLSRARARMRQALGPDYAEE